jgi:hypothetical protein
LVADAGAEINLSIRALVKEQEYSTGVQYLL